jgi:molecular chaperone DnaK (HSP70)
MLTICKECLIIRVFPILFQKLSRQATLEDINGKKIEALAIFSMSIKYLKGHLHESLSKQVTGVEETDILYVLTVPAIWDDSAKQFMREAAIKVVLNRLYGMSVGGGAR